MLIGQQVGPFVIDRELGSGAMGAVYRGRHAKTGKLVAIKVMAPGLGGTNRRAAERFEREVEILKQLDHPNVVHFYGAGTHEGVRWFAMEYLQGESLDKVMSRRGRMSWEEVVELGQQLCLALQHAHEKGIIHRDLKPSNLMVLPNGSLKLTDFGIAKDTDVTQLTSANCTVGTAAYMSPEQCKGERDLTHKSDLYSLGILLYELITGRKPFNAENAMEMFLLHVQGTCPRPAKLVLELPVWMDNLICQLLEKKPENRPLDAAMVYNALGTVKEKVEAQQSAGVDVARRRKIDRTPGAPKPKLDAEDKEAARFLLRGKVRPGRKPGRPFYEKAWFQAVGILTILGGMGLALYLVFRPPSPDKLYATAEQTLKSIVADPTAAEAGEGLIRAYLSNDDSRGKLDEVRDRGPVGEYLRRYEAQMLRDPRTKQMRQWADAIDCAVCERQLMRHLNGSKVVQPEGELEKLAFGAADAEKAAEKEGNKVMDALRKWLQVKGGADRGWAMTAERHLPLCAVAARVLGYERYGDLPRAKISCDQLENETRARPEQQNALFAFAREKSKKLQEKDETLRKEIEAQQGDEKPSKEALAKKFNEAISKKINEAVAERLAEAQKLYDEGQKSSDAAKYQESWNICQEIIDLYDRLYKGGEVQKLVDKARPLRDKAALKFGSAQR
jgi:predicted Ser/Thr protein kinase